MVLGDANSRKRKKVKDYCIVTMATVKMMTMMMTVMMK